MIGRFLNENIKLDNTIDTPTSKSFKKWFGNSIVVDSKGNPRVMYHGTNVEFHTFRTNSEMGIHVGDLEASRSINNYKGGDIVMSLYVRIENPLRLSDVLVFEPQDVLPQLTKSTKIPKEVCDKLQSEYQHIVGLSKDSKKDIKKHDKQWENLKVNIVNELKLLGYDGIVYKNKKEGKVDSYIAFDTNQVKSIYNEGGWKNTEGNIYK